MRKIFIPLAVLALLGFPIAVLGYRLDLFNFLTSYRIMQWTVYLALALFFVGMVVTFLKRRSDPELSKAARTASYLAIIPIVALGSQIFTARSVPSIHNISTDTVNPPAFERVTEIRSAEHNPLDYDAEKLAAIQSEAYPDVTTLMTELSVADAHARALAIAESEGWDIVNSDPARGIIEATDTTLVWGFKDDVVIRVSEKEGMRAVDLRSVSRIGRSDLGANAKRIKKFLNAFGA